MAGLCFHHHQHPFSCPLRLTTTTIDSPGFNLFCVNYPSGAPNRRRRCFITASVSKSKIASLTSFYWFLPLTFFAVVLVLFRKFFQSFPESKRQLEIEKEREFLERYGLDPDEFLSEPSSKVQTFHPFIFARLPFSSSPFFSPFFFLFVFIRVLTYLVVINLMSRFFDFIGKQEKRGAKDWRKGKTIHYWGTQASTGDP